MQRRRLLDALFARRTEALAGRAVSASGVAAWPAHFERLSAILAGRGAP